MSSYKEVTNRNWRCSRYSKPISVLIFVEAFQKYVFQKFSEIFLGKEGEYISQLYFELKSKFAVHSKSYSL